MSCLQLSMVCIPLTLDKLAFSDFALGTDVDLQVEYSGTPEAVKGYRDWAQKMVKILNALSRVRWAMSSSWILRWLECVDLRYRAFTVYCLLIEML
jgi:hypothetical protein